MNDIKINDDLKLPTASKQAIQKIQAYIMANPQLQTEPPQPRHDFGSSLYMRSIEAKAGDLLIGYTHNYDHAFILAKGRVLCVSEYGSEIIEAGHRSIGKPGIKRACLVLEDCVMVNVHFNPCNDTDIESLEQFYVDKNEDVSDLISLFDGCEINNRLDKEVL